MKPPRTLFLTVDVPYPPASGAPLRNWQNIALACGAGPVAVLSIGHDACAANDLPGVSVYRHVTIPREGTTAFRGFPHVAGRAAEMVGDALVAMAAAFAPTLIVFENVWVTGIAALVRKAGSRLVYDAHNVYAELAGELGLDAALVRGLEAIAVASADDVWVCSAADADRMLHLYPTMPAPRVIPNGIDTDFYRRIRERGPRAPRAVITLVFIGSYWYEPNRVAAEVLMHEIVPAVRERSGARVQLHLVGAAPSSAMRANTDPDIVIAGRVADVRPYLSVADSIVIPLRAGGGTRLKVLEAFAAGRPVIATAKAAEGIAVLDERHLLLRETASAMAEAVVALHRDPARAAALTREAYALVASRYAWTALAGTVRSALVEAPLRARYGAVRPKRARSTNLA